MSFKLPNSKSLVLRVKVTIKFHYSIWNHYPFGKGEAGEQPGEGFICLLNSAIQETNRALKQPSCQLKYWHCTYLQTTDVLKLYIMSYYVQITCI